MRPRLFSLLTSLSAPPCRRRGESKQSPRLPDPTSSQCGGAHAEPGRTRPHFGTAGQLRLVREIVIQDSAPASAPAPGCSRCRRASPPGPPLARSGTLAVRFQVAERRSASGEGMARRTKALSASSAAFHTQKQTRLDVVVPDPLEPLGPAEIAIVVHHLVRDIPRPDPPSVPAATTFAAGRHKRPYRGFRGRLTRGHTSR